MGGAPAGGQLGSLFADLTVDMPAEWQLVDLGIRCFRTALKTQGMQGSDMAKVNAVIRRLASTATTLLSHYTGGSSQAPKTPRLGEEEMSDPGSLNSPDADAAPGLES